MRSDEPGDLTARAAIRNAALRLFAERGADAVTVRAIGEAAGVSPALVVHHYGSKVGLRAAVDEYVTAQFDHLMDDPDEVGETLAAGSGASIAELFTRALPPDSPLPAYLRRLLLEGDPVGRDLFRRWYEVTRQLMDQLTEAGYARPSNDPAVRAAFMLSADMVLVLLNDQLADVLGTDPLSEDGLLRWAAEVTDIYRTGALRAGEEDDDD